MEMTDFDFVDFMIFVTLLLILQLHIGLCSLYHNGALDTLSLKLTAYVIGIEYVSVKLVRICRASARAVKPCKAFPALVLGVHIAAFEFIHDLSIVYSVKHCAEFETVKPHKLVTRVEVSRRRYRKVLRTRAAARQSFIYTRSSGQVKLEVEKRNRLSCLLSLD